MLVLSRRVGEKIIIGDDIEVMVLGIQGNQCRIGVSAPKDVEIDREEIRERKNTQLTLQIKLRQIQIKDTITGF